MKNILFAVEVVTAEETRKVLIGEDPQQETRPKKRLVKFTLDFLAFIIIIFIMASVKILIWCTIVYISQEVGTVLETQW